MQKKTKKTQHAAIEDCLRIAGARTNNLQNIHVNIPYGELVFISGLTGSGKSSLGQHTILAEGSLRYIESFSTNARLFLDKVKRPDVDHIQGLPASIGLIRKPPSKNPRLRMATTTDIYSYLKLLYARFGTTISPISGEVVKKNTAQDVFAYTASIPEGSELRIAAPLLLSGDKNGQDALITAQKKGFTRVIQAGETQYIADLLTQKNRDLQDTALLIDRIKVNREIQKTKDRIIDSAKTAFFEGKGICIVDIVGRERRVFSDQFEADGIQFISPIPHFFDFNNAHGACPQCNGLGKGFDIDASKVIPDPSRSVAEGAILPWQTASFNPWQTDFITSIEKFDFPIHRPYKDLNHEERRLVWKGNAEVKGISSFFEWVLSQEQTTQYRILYASYYGKTTCRACEGSGLRKEVGYVKINQKSIIDLLRMNVDELYDFFTALNFPKHQKAAAGILIEAIKKRLYYLKKVGLGYLSLSRFTATLSGGEYQRARFAKILGSPLIDSLYVLEGISVGLHQHNIKPITEVLRTLADMGNTVIVIGQEESIMREASMVIDMGPEGGKRGGKVLFQGPFEQLPAAKNSYTADYLANRRIISMPTQRRPWTQQISLHDIQKNNLKIPHFSLPLNVFVTITGVSGSGKSTLIDEVLYEALQSQLKKALIATRSTHLITGDLGALKQVKYVQQGAISKSSRSNIATYIKVFDHIRKLFVDHPLSKARDYTISHFSFNTAGGRCEACAGEGIIKIDMQIMDDVTLTCQDCQGKQFQKEILEITYKGKNIIEILDMTIAQSVDFFNGCPQITAKLKPLVDLGLGEVKIGQSSNTLSSGESQKLKIAQAIPEHENRADPTLFIFDEPSTDLHVHDIEKCIQLFRKLIDKGHSIVAIEHNLEMIKSADWVIDVGPGAGEQGGEIIFEGTPDDMLKETNNHTARYLKAKVERDRHVTHL